MTRVTSKNKAIAAAIFFFVFALAFSQPAKAQTSTADTGFTPYSLFGYGDLFRQGTGYNMAMGGTGIGDRNVRYINILNPAAVTAREAKSFMASFGVEQRDVYFAGNQATSINPGTSSELLKSVNNTFNMHHIVASFPIYKHSAFKVGIMPYSTVGYSFRSHEEDDDLVSSLGDIQYTNVGQGGINQAFLGAGVTLFNRLSLGADAYYYFGTINRYSTAAFATATQYRSMKTGWEYVLRGFSGKFGLQYEQPLGGQMAAVIGATYKLGSQLHGDVTRFAYGYSSSSTDTIVSVKTPASGMDIPQEFGGGISIRRNEHWTIALDYTYQDWTSTYFSDEVKGSHFTSSKAQSFRAGFELTPDRFSIRSYMDRVTYRIGCYHEDSYVALNNHQVTANGITFGMSFPVFRYFNAITFSVDLGQRGSLANNLIRERYVLFNLSFDLHDIWFIKPLYN